MGSSGDKKLVISIVTACYNEEENVEQVYGEIKKIREEYSEKYDWEHIFIDNASIDSTLKKLRRIAANDQDVKVIVNLKNFGHIRSPYYGYTNASGDATIVFFCDLQEPVSLIHEFIQKWEEGYKVIVGVKVDSEENKFKFVLRKTFYRFLKMISETGHISNFSGYGLYDKSFINIIKRLDEPYPYFRGLVAEYGFDFIELHYKQQLRKRGVSKNSWYDLYDSAALGLVSHSKVPLRLASFMGFLTALLSLLIAVIYFIYKILVWNTFEVGMPVVIIGVFFLGGVQLLFLGVLGEYIGNILTRVTNRPLVIEKERINFDED